MITGDIVKAISVLAISTFEMWLAVPAGFQMGLSIFTIITMSVTGSVVGVLAASAFGLQLRKVFRVQKDLTAKKGVRGWLLKHGVYMIALVGPLVVGATVSALLASGAGYEKSKWLPMLIAAACIWPFFLVFSIHVGFNFIN